MSKYINVLMQPKPGLMNVMLEADTIDRVEFMQEVQIQGYNVPFKVATIFYKDGHEPEQAFLDAETEAFWIEYCSKSQKSSKSEQKSEKKLDK